MRSKVIRWKMTTPEGWPPSGWNGRVAKVKLVGEPREYLTWRASLTHGWTDKAPRQWLVDGLIPQNACDLNWRRGSGKNHAGTRVDGGDGGSSRQWLDERCLDGSRLEGCLRRMTGGIRASAGSASSGCTPFERVASDATVLLRRRIGHNHCRPR
jgi:hypothetical protein